METILVTHTHRDHSALANELRQATGARIVGPPPFQPKDDEAGLDSAHDLAYAPDAVLADGERLAARTFTIEAVATPGHCGEHLCLALLEERALFSGDHVMAWSTSVVAPPDGSMGAYMASLEKVARPRRDDLLARARRAGARAATLCARARPSPSPAGGVHPGRARSRGGDRPGAGRESLCRSRSLARPRRAGSRRSPISRTCASAALSSPPAPPPAILASAAPDAASDMVQPAAARACPLGVAANGALLCEARRGAPRPPTEKASSPALPLARTMLSLAASASRRAVTENRLDLRRDRRPERESLAAPGAPRIGQLALRHPQRSPRPMPPDQQLRRLACFHTQRNFGHSCTCSRSCRSDGSTPKFSTVFSGTTVNSPVNTHQPPIGFAQYGILRSALRRRVSASFSTESVPEVSGGSPPAWVPPVIVADGHPRAGRRASKCRGSAYCRRPAGGRWGLESRTRRGYGVRRDLRWKQRATPRPAPPSHLRPDARPGPKPGAPEGRRPREFGWMNKAGVRRTRGEEHGSNRAGRPPLPFPVPRHNREFSFPAIAVTGIFISMREVGSGFGGLPLAETDNAAPEEDLLSKVGRGRIERFGCPHCGQDDIRRWGKAGGKPRYRCTSCRKTFNPLTGTPLAGWHHQDRWPDQAQALIAGETVAKAAERCKVAYTTAFRWRHRFLSRSIWTSRRACRGLSRRTRPSSSNPSRASAAICREQRASGAARPTSGVCRRSRSQSSSPATAPARPSMPSCRGSTPPASRPRWGSSCPGQRELCCDGGAAITAFARRANNFHPLPAPGAPKPEAPTSPHQQRERLPRAAEGVDAALPWRRHQEPAELSELAASARGPLKSLDPGRLDPAAARARELYQQLIRNKSLANCPVSPPRSSVGSGTGAPV